LKLDKVTRGREDNETVPGQGDTETGRQGEEKKELFEIHPSGDTTRAPKVLNKRDEGRL